MVIDSMCFLSAYGLLWFIGLEYNPFWMFFMICLKFCIYVVGLNVTLRCLWTVDLITGYGIFRLSTARRRVLGIYYLSSPGTTC